MLFACDACLLVECLENARSCISRYCIVHVFANLITQKQSRAHEIHALLKGLDTHCSLSLLQYQQLLVYGLHALQSEAGTVSFLIPYCHPSYHVEPVGFSKSIQHTSCMQHICVHAGFLACNVAPVLASGCLHCWLHAHTHTHICTSLARTLEICQCCCFSSIMTIHHVAPKDWWTPAVPCVLLCSDEYW